jgi:hypothetical protein
MSACAECGDPVASTGSYQTTKGLVCKWCRSIAHVEAQRRVASRTPMNRGYSSSGGDGTQALRVIFGILIPIILMSLRHCH